jgi:hypothetical protein
MALEDATNPVRGVSGPGKFSKRTDLQYKPDAYGDGVAMQQQKAGAPLAQAQKSPMLSQAPQVPTGGGQAPLAGLYDPTNRPDEPVTTGIDMGAGRGSDALLMRSPDNTAFAAKIAEYMPVLSYIAGRSDTSPETRAAIRQLRDYA